MLQPLLGHISASAAAGEVGGDDDEGQDDESHGAHHHDSMSGQQNLIDGVPPFISPTSWIVMASPDSSDALKAFQWRGKKLDMKFEGGWSTASYKRPCSRKEGPEGYDLFHYKDKGTKSDAHMLDLQEYGVTEKWVMPEVVAIAQGVLTGTAPVAPLTVMPSPAASEVTPVLVMVNCPAANEVEIPVPFAYVVEATHWGTPLFQVRT